MADEGSSRTVPFIDNPLAPEFAATEAAGFFLHAGNVYITFAAPRLNHGNNPPITSRVVIGRLCMPIIGAQGLAANLYDFLKKQGLDPVPTPEKDKLQ
jgi:hypothetical protein